MEGAKKVEDKVRRRWTDIIIRILALSLTLVAAVIVGLDKQSKRVPVSIAPGLRPALVAVTAKWRYMSAFVYFVASNAIACSYAAASTLLSLAAGSRRSSGTVLTLLMLDVIMVGLLFSANGAAAAIGLIGYNGNSHVQWKQVCDVFDTFCHRVATSLALSLLGSLNFLFLVVLGAFSLRRK